MNGPDAALRPRPLALAATALTGVLSGGLLGGMTNAVNGAVSPEYFVAVMRWRGVDDVWRAAVAQGVFEGLLFGLAFSVVYTAAAGLVTGAACTLGFAVRHLLGIVAGAALCWALGGVAAMALAAISPEFYSRTFRDVPGEFGAMLRYAWVGGSIWGVQLGGFASLVVGLVVLRANWRRRTEAVGR